MEEEQDQGELFVLTAFSWIGAYSSYEKARQAYSENYEDFKNDYDDKYERFYKRYEEYEPPPEDLDSATSNREFAECVRVKVGHYEYDLINLVNNSYYDQDTEEEIEELREHGKREAKYDGPNQVHLLISHNNNMTAVDTDYERIRNEMIDRRAARIDKDLGIDGNGMKISGEKDQVIIQAYTDEVFNPPDNYEKIPAIKMFEPSEGPWNPVFTYCVKKTTHGGLFIYDGCYIATGGPDELIPIEVDGPMILYGDETVIDSKDMYE